MKHCNHCNKPVFDHNAKACSNCGTELHDNEVMDMDIVSNYKPISKIGGAVAAVSVLFLPIVGCGGESVNGLDVIKGDHVDGILKACVAASVLCGIIILFLHQHKNFIAMSIAGILSLLAGYMIARNKLPVELKAGAFLAFLAFGTTAGVNFMAKSKPAPEDDYYTEAPVAETSSVADQLASLKKLLDEGAITQEEFDEQKRRLLS